MPDSGKPISDKQIAANRANARRSTGPRTPERRARSAQNARKHGFTASTFAIVRLDELDEIARLKDDLFATYQPVNSQELFAIERIALAQHFKKRFAVRLLARHGSRRPLYQIASEIGVSVRMLGRYRGFPQFRNAVNRNCRAFGRRLFDRRVHQLQAEAEARVNLLRTYSRLA